jgi:hypothetical protein
VRVAVSGGRDYADRERVYDVLDAMHKQEPITLIIQGQCYKGGADYNHNRVTKEDAYRHRHADRWTYSHEYMGAADEATGAT